MSSGIGDFQRKCLKSLSASFMNKIVDRVVIFGRFCVKR